MVLAICLVLAACTALTGVVRAAVRAHRARAAGDLPAAAATVLPFPVREAGADADAAVAADLAS